MVIEKIMRDIVDSWRQSPATADYTQDQPDRTSPVWFHLAPFTIEREPNDLCATDECCLRRMCRACLLAPHHSLPYWRRGGFAGRRLPQRGCIRHWAIVTGPNRFASILKRNYWEAFDEEYMRLFRSKLGLTIAMPSDRCVPPRAHGRALDEGTSFSAGDFSDALRCTGIAKRAGGEDLPPFHPATMPLQLSVLGPKPLVPSVGAWAGVLAPGHRGRGVGGRGAGGVVG